MSNEKAWARAQRAARASYMDPPKKKISISILFKSGNVAHTHIHTHTKNKNTTQ